MNYEKLADLLFPEINKDIQFWEEKYPKRNLYKNALVTRIAPSPTGFLHLGNLYNSIIGFMLTKKNKNNIFFLRVEDTDSKREVPGAAAMIIREMNRFGIVFSEGISLTNIDVGEGDYAPYRQSKRVEIYKTFAKHLVKKGVAYPCFCSEDALLALRETQITRKLTPGYHGDFAPCRNLDFETIKSKISSGASFVLRLASPFSETDGKLFTITDEIKGTLSLPENFTDIVLLKSDKIPTYHFAHIVDDHLMRTTHVIRGEEWISTLPIHIMIYRELFGTMPSWKYCHTAQLMKLDDDTNTKRKLSKRKDLELSLDYYSKKGYPLASIWEYMLTIINSNYEEWHSKNPDLSYLDFPFDLKKMSKSGTLFDLNKLDNISREILGNMTALDFYNEVSAWASQNDIEFYNKITKNKDYTIRAFNVGRGGKKPRKDFANFSESTHFLNFYFEEPHINFSKEEREILYLYKTTLDLSDSKEVWFEKIKSLCEKNNFALSPKEYKKNPENYKGSIADFTNVIRKALCGRENAPDIYEIQNVLSNKVFSRLSGMS